MSASTRQPAHGGKTGARVSSVRDLVRSTTRAVATGAILLAALAPAAATAAPPAPAPYGQNDAGGFHNILPPGEGSNVNVVEEFIQMIMAQRSYEANSRVVSAADQIFQQLNNLGR